MPSNMVLHSIRSKTVQALMPAFLLLLLSGGTLAQTTAPDFTSGSDDVSIPRSETLEPDWTTVPYDPYPLMEAVPNNPVLAKHDLTDLSGVQFVADPFLFNDNGTWFMFFEVWQAYGKIALAVSGDGLDWTYLQVILDEALHHSFPLVLFHEGEYYMITESSDTNAVQLHRATNFPFSWQDIGNLVSGREFVDPSVFHYNDRWWMFVGLTGSAVCYLYSSDSLHTGWTEHPMSPIINGNRSKARPAGRTVVLADGRILRPAQKCDVTYGEAVRLFEVDVLTETSYAEHEIPDESPILAADGDGWNEGGMHHWDPWWNHDHWLAAVDGWSQALSWSIGVYRTSSVEAVPSGPIHQFLRLAPNYPNPFGSSTRITYELLDDSAAGPVHLGIYDSSGRRIRMLVEDEATPGIHGALWDGMDSQGRPVPGGIYFYRLGLDDNRSITRRMTLIR